jgi:hypothetical protein
VGHGNLSWTDQLALQTKRIMNDDE